MSDRIWALQYRMSRCLCDPGHEQDRDPEPQGDQRTERDEVLHLCHLEVRRRCVTSGGRPAWSTPVMLTPHGAPIAGDSTNPSRGAHDSACGAATSARPLYHTPKRTVKPEDCIHRLLTDYNSLLYLRHHSRAGRTITELATPVLHTPLMKGRWFRLITRQPRPSALKVSSVTPQDRPIPKGGSGTPRDVPPDRDPG